MKPGTSETIAGNFQRRPEASRLYVWTVTACTFLLLAMMIWPMSVKRFQSTVTFQLRFDPTSHMEKREISDLIVEEIQNHTESGRLQSLLSLIPGQPTSDLLREVDREKIRKAIRIQNRPGTAANTIWFRVSLVGAGSPDEVQFVNSLVSRVTSNVGTSKLRQSALQSIDQLTQEFDKQQRAFLSRYAEPLNSAITGIRSAGNELQIIVDNLNQIGKLSTQTPSATGNPRADQLRNQISMLESQKREQLVNRGINQYHPRIVRIQEEIERLTFQLGQSRSNSNGKNSRRDIALVTNQFASNRKETALSKVDQSAVKNLLVEMQMIDLRGPREQLLEMSQAVTQRNDELDVLVNRMNAMAKGNLSLTNPISIDHVRTAKRSQPIGGVPSWTRFLFLAVVSGLMATVITWKFDPTTRKRRFGSVQQIQQRLGIPVVGTLRSRPVRVRPTATSAKLSNLVVTACEWIILLMLIALVVAALMNSEVVHALLENPFEAASKTFWLIAPHG